MQVKTRGLTFEVAVDGPADGVPVLLSNSLGASLAMWRVQAANLAGRYRVVRYDQRGHGGSQVVDASFTMDAFVDDALDLMDALELERVHFVGLSMGGMTALGLALRAPGRLRSIVAANCVAEMGAAAQATWDERARIALSEGLRSLVAPSLERWFSARALARRGEELRAHGAMIAATPVAGYVAACRALKTLAWLSELQRISVPTLFISGLQDVGAPPAAMRDMHARVAHSRLLELDCAHLSNLECPREFDAALAEFFAGLA